MLVLGLWARVSIMTRVRAGAGGWARIMTRAGAGAGAWARVKTTAKG